jgi:NTE family protein
VVQGRVPQVLVLGGGGILGEAWMSGFLAGAQHATGVDFRDAKMFVGTSAGAFVAAYLASGVQPRTPQASTGIARVHTIAPNTLRTATTRSGQHWLTAVYPVVGRAVTAGAQAGALARAALLARAPAGTRSLADLHADVAAWASQFDERLRIVAVDRASGRRVVFGASGAPAASVPDAVAASCAIPGVFTPVRIAGREYVDGGVWSATNIDVATIGRGDEVLCLAPTHALATSQSAAVRAIAAVWRLTTTLEATAARTRGATVTVVSPDARVAAAMGPNLMDPRPREQVLAEGFRQGSTTCRDTP